MVIINKTYRPLFVVSGVDISQDHTAGISGTDDHNTFHIVSAFSAQRIQKPDKPIGKTDPGGKRKLTDTAENVIGNGHAPSPDGHAAHIDGDGHHRSQTDTRQFHKAGKFPYTAVKLKDGKQKHAEKRIEKDALFKSIQINRINGIHTTVKTDPQRKKKGTAYCRYIKQHQEYLDQFRMSVFSAFFFFHFTFFPLSKTSGKIIVLFFEISVF